MYICQREKISCRRNKSSYRRMSRARLPSSAARRVLRAHPRKNPLRFPRTRLPPCPAPVCRYIITICGTQTGLSCTRLRFNCTRLKFNCTQFKPPFRQDTLKRPPVSPARVCQRRRGVRASRSFCRLVSRGPGVFSGVVFWVFWGYSGGYGYR